MVVFSSIKLIPYYLAAISPGQIFGELVGVLVIEVRKSVLVLSVARSEAGGITWVMIREYYCNGVGPFSGFRLTMQMARICEGDVLLFVFAVHHRHL